jgi:hypothetical protein
MSLCNITAQKTVTKILTTLETSNLSVIVIIILNTQPGAHVIDQKLATKWKHIHSQIIMSEQYASSIPVTDKYMKKIAIPSAAYNNKKISVDTLTWTQ